MVRTMEKRQHWMASIARLVMEVLAGRVGLEMRILMEREIEETGVGE